MATLSQVIVPSNIATSTNTLTMSNKTLTAPVISGGTIDNATIGATTPTTGAFTVASVNGVQFPATQVPSANANQLDDYEEGTFTPTVVGSTTAGTATYTTRVGVYTKIGNLVSVSMGVIYTGHTGTGNMNLTGLPFAASIATGGSILVSGLASPASTFPNILISGSTMAFYGQTISTGALGFITIDAAADFYITATYRVA